MTNKNMGLCIYLVLNGLFVVCFDTAWPLSPHNHYIVEVVMAVPRVYIVFAVISLTFAGLLLQQYNDNAYNICIRL